MAHTTQDFPRALHYFKAAAAKGDVEASAQIGHLFANGLGVQADNDTAVRCGAAGARIIGFCDVGSLPVA